VTRFSADLGSSTFAAGAGLRPAGGPPTQGTSSARQLSTAPLGVEQRSRLQGGGPWGNQGFPHTRTIIVFVPGALALAAGWIRLEQPSGDAWKAAALTALALVPALLRPGWLRAPALVASALAAVNVAFGASALSSATVSGAAWVPRGLPSALVAGFLSFYDVDLPFAAGTHPLMHGMVLLAAWGFALAFALLAAARRALAAAFVLLVGAGWPATLLSGAGDVPRGLLILLALIVVLVGLRPGGRARPAHAAAGAAGALAVAAVAAASPAVARSGLLDWQRWDPYTKASGSVSVEYVWRSTYDGIRFPQRPTTVFRVQAPARPYYWRAATLDVFDGRGFDESRETVALGHQAPQARVRLTRQEVTIGALRDDHLVAASVPVRFVAPQGGPVSVTPDGVAYARYGLTRGEHYVVFSRTDAPTAGELRRSPARYPKALAARFLEVAPGVGMPPWGSARRARAVRALLREHAHDPRVGPYTGVVRRADEVARAARSPYAAAARLEAWLRLFGGFRYDQQPPLPRSLPPLADFVLRTKAGYCQHFAGAMALMLRYLGIPARVAAGFTSGSYDPSTAMWVVADRDAHTWVEVWFAGVGWVPFDPTPGRGTLPGSYTASSPRFDASALGAALSWAAFGLGSQRLPLDDAVPGRATDARPDGGGPDVALLAAALGTTAGASALGLLGLVKSLRRRRRLAAREARALAAACRGVLVGFLADQGVAVSPTATPRELASLLDRRLGVAGTRFAGALETARYAPAAEADAVTARCRSELAAVLTGVRGGLSARQRARGVLSLRSLTRA
jgi:protein-glutamine gamma-glutamyltransferase